MINWWKSLATAFRRSPKRAERLQPRPGAARLIECVLEPLESRIAPANLLNARTIVFNDVDGDLVQIVFSKDVFLGTDTAMLAKANDVFKFNTGTVTHDTTMQGPQQLQLIDLTKLPTVLNVGSIANGASMTITATTPEGGSGNGLADVGLIAASGISLNKVVVDGDLGKIVVGRTSAKVGITNLTVASLGTKGTATQIPVANPTTDNPAPDLISAVTGEITSLNILGDLNDARFQVVDGKIGSTITTAAKIGSITVGGSIIGKTAVEAASDNTGVIECDRAIGVVKIGTPGTAPGGIVGGGGANSGRISANGGITSVTIAGNLAGGGGSNSGMVNAAGSIGSVSIGGDLVGGTGVSSGLIRSYGNLTTLTIGDDILAGKGEGSAFVSIRGAISKITIKGDINGELAGADPSGAGSAGISANGIIAANISGSIIGGEGAGSGVLESDRNIGTIKAKTAFTPEVLTGVTIGGSIIGGTGDGSGAVSANGTIRLLSVAGNINGGAGIQSGVVHTGLDTHQDGELHSAIVKGAIVGGEGNNSGALLAGGAIGTVTLGSTTAPTADALKGGHGMFSGSISAYGKIGAVRITGNVLGGEGIQSGSVTAFEQSGVAGDIAGNIGTITISGGLSGGVGDKSGRIAADGALAILKAGSWTGGTGIGSGTLATGLGFLGTGNVGTLTILGDISKAAASPGAGSAEFFIDGRLTSLSVGDDTMGAAIRVSQDIGTLTFTGNVTDSTVTAQGRAVQTATSDLTIATLTVRGNVANSSFLAGYNLAGNAVNPDAQIGTVSVKGNWTASNLVAGVSAGADTGFGNPLDVKAPGDDSATILSKIANIIIGGTVTGASGQNFGFVAQLVAKAKVGTHTFALNNLADLQVFEVGSAGSGVDIREVALT
jgi:hypothetical protein